jgi:hypothetical protein
MRGLSGLAISLETIFLEKNTSFFRKEKQYCVVDAKSPRCDDYRSCGPSLPTVVGYRDVAITWNVA